MHVHFHVIPKRDKAEGLIINEETWPRVEVGIEGLQDVRQEIAEKLQDSAVSADAEANSSR
jgi:diadenosine tetraphosphate (Ap4A) HIT family hydrolase